MNFRTLIGHHLGGIGTSAIGSRAILAGRAGITFEGKRDLFQALGYRRLITLADYRDRYLRNAVAGRIVDAKPQDTWRSGFELLEDEREDTRTDFEEAWEELEKRLSVTAMMMRLDTLAGIGHYSVMLLGAEGEMVEPLEQTDDLAFISVFAEEDARILTLEPDTKDKRFGLPTFYSLRRRNSNNLVATRVIEDRVHHSRIIHAADGLLEDMIFGTPRLQRIWNLLDDLEKVTGGGAEAFWKRADQGMQLNLDPTVELDDDGTKELQEEVDKYIHGLTRVLRTRGLDINMLGSDTADIGGPTSAILEQISAGTGIPQRILMGSEQAKLASIQDRSNWNERIEARRNNFAEAQIIRPFVDRMIAFGVLPEPKQYEVRWSQIESADEGGQAEYANSLADLNTKMGERVVTPDEIRTRALGWGALENAQPLPPVTASKKLLSETRRALKIKQLKKALEDKDEQKIMELVSAALEIMNPISETTRKAIRELADGAVEERLTVDELALHVATEIAQTQEEK